jgi:hypothetical protein
MRRFSLMFALAFVVSLVVATNGAQAVVVNDQGNYSGVALVPSTSSSLAVSSNVLGPAVQPLSPPQTTGSPPPTPLSPAPGVHLQLMPQGLLKMLRFGLSVRVSSNERADGIATLSISRKSARQAHIRTGRGLMVVVGRGTVSGIKNGTVNLHLRLTRAVAAKLGRLRHVTLTLRLALVTAGGVHLAIDAAGSY